MTHPDVVRTYLLVVLVVVGCMALGLVVGCAVQFVEGAL